MPWIQKHKRSSGCIASHLIMCKLLTMKKYNHIIYRLFFRKTKTLKVLDSVPGIYFWNGPEHQRVCLTLFWALKRAVPENDSAGNDICPQASSALPIHLFHHYHPVEERKFTPVSCPLEPFLSPSSVFNPPNLTLSASHLEKRSAFTFWQSEGWGRLYHISVLKCGSLSI